MGVYPYVHHINDVMVSVLASIVGLSPVWVKLKTIKLAWREQVKFRCSDDDMHFVLDQHVYIAH
jgi:hypothetical protein